MYCWCSPTTNLPETTISLDTRPSRAPATSCSGRPTSYARSSTASGAWNDRCLTTASWTQPCLASADAGATMYENRSPFTEHLKTMLAISSRFTASLTSPFGAASDLTISSGPMLVSDRRARTDTSRGDGEWALVCRHRYIGQSSDDT